jgi:nicotinamidase-related amidase
MTLLHRDDSVLVVVDAQPGFYAAENLDSSEAAAARTALERAAWLSRVAARLEIPAVITEEDAARNGPTDAAVREALPASTPVFDKPTFGLAGTPEILAAIRATGRGTAVLVGFETDVCVAQSAVGLVGADLRAVVVEDAAFSPGAMHALGLARAAAAGVEINHCKGVAYEWLRELETARSVLGSSPALSDAPLRL